MFNKQTKQSFTLIELLVAMAVIAILLGIGVVGISIVQRNARDTLRINKLKEIDISINGALASGKALPQYFYANVNNTSNQIYDTTSGIRVSLPDFLNRGASQPGGSWIDATTESTTAYCYWRVDTQFVIGVQLESGQIVFRSNSGYNFLQTD